MLAGPFLSSAIVVISDFSDGWPPEPSRLSRSEAALAGRAGRHGPFPGLDPAYFGRAGEPAVVGNYLERLPPAAIRNSLVDYAEIWPHWRPSTPPVTSDAPFLRCRAFHQNSEQAPFHSDDMLGFIDAFGPPKILCVWGPDVSEAVLQACSDSFIIYNSIDAPALRVPQEVSRHFDLVLTGAQWEYMLAGLPVVANADLSCGLQYIPPDTGIVVPAGRFEAGILEALDAPGRFNPRARVLEHWARPHTIEQLAALLPLNKSEGSPLRIAR